MTSLGHSLPQRDLSFRIRYRYIDINLKYLFNLQLKCFEEICKSACIPSSVRLYPNPSPQVPFQLPQLLQPRSGIIKDKEKIYIYIRTSSQDPHSQNHPTMSNRVRPRFQAWMPGSKPRCQWTSTWPSGGGKLEELGVVVQVMDPHKQNP